MKKCHKWLLALLAFVGIVVMTRESSNRCAALWRDMCLQNVNSCIYDYMDSGMDLVYAAKTENDNYSSVRDWFLIQTGDLTGQIGLSLIPPEYWEEYPKALQLISDIGRYSYSLPYSAKIAKEEFKNGDLNQLPIVLGILKDAKASTLEKTLENIEAHVLLPKISAD